MTSDDNWLHMIGKRWQLMIFEPTGWKPSERFRHFFICSLGWGGVGWGNTVHVLAYSHDVTPRHVHLHVCTYVMLRWRCVTSRRGGVGWGGVITFTYLRTPMMLRHGTFTCTCAHTSCYVEDVSRHAGVGWGGWGNNVHVLAHSHGENRCVLSEDVEITRKNGCRWGFGHTDFPKGTFFARRHVNYIQ